MFGRAEWFRLARNGRIRPGTWRGRCYMAAWGAAIVVPAIVLATLGRLPETLIWLLIMACVWRRDFRPIRAAHARTTDLFVIDETTDITLARRGKGHPPGLERVASKPA
ncbi:MAG: hypothetical protein FJ297_01720 [Planctomycetes bacterium]|nr:hypothetical protein [Planctomycetota bacterium]